MSWIYVITWVSGIASIVALPTSVVLARRSSKQKGLTYDVTPPLGIASILPQKADYSLSITFQHGESPPQNVGGAYLRFMRIGNLGREPVRQGDIAPSDRLRIQIRDALLLDITVADETRQTINFRLMPEEPDADGVTVIPIAFDFMDYQDIVLIRMLTDTYEAKAEVHGTVIGMPKGVINQSYIGSFGFVGGIKLLSALAVGYAATFGLTIYCFHRITHDWHLAWLALLPVVATLLPPIAIIAGWIMLSSRVARWPKKPRIPDWFVPDMETPNGELWFRDGIETSSKGKSSKP